MNLRRLIVIEQAAARKRAFSLSMGGVRDHAADVERRARAATGVTATGLGVCEVAHCLCFVNG